MIDDIMLPGRQSSEECKLHAWETVFGWSIREKCYPQSLFQMFTHVYTTKQQTLPLMTYLQLSGKQKKRHQNSPITVTKNSWHWSTAIQPTAETMKVYMSSFTVEICTFSFRWLPWSGLQKIPENIMETCFCVIVVFLGLHFCFDYLRDLS